MNQYVKVLENVIVNGKEYKPGIHEVDDDIAMALIKTGKATDSVNLAELRGVDQYFKNRLEADKRVIQRHRRGGIN